MATARKAKRPPTYSWTVVIGGMWSNEDNESFTVRARTEKDARDRALSRLRGTQCIIDIIQNTRRRRKTKRTTK